MFTRHKLREKALELSLCGAIYPKQSGFFKQEETVSSEEAASMLSPVTVGCVCKADESLHRWVQKNTH